MIDQLLNLSRDLRETLYGSVNDRLPNGARGALIGVDRFWIEAYKYEAYRRRHEFFPDLGGDKAFQRWSVFLDQTFDFTYKPRRWSEHCKLVGLPENSSPIYFTVIPHSAKDLQYVGKLPTQVEGYPIIYNYYPRCEGLNGLSNKLKSPLAKIVNRFRRASELSIGRAKPDTAGTLGGVLRCPVTGKLYIVSCAHVLGPTGTEVYRPGPYEGFSSSMIAEVRFSQLAEPTPSGIPCHPLHIPDAGRLDVSIAEVTEDASGFANLISATRAKHVRSIMDMRLSDQVFFLGKKSGLVTAEIEHLIIWDEVLIDERIHCFKDVFTMTFPDPWYLNEEISEGGDSGA